MADAFAVYDTVWDRYVGGTSADEAAQQTIADALTASTGRAHTVVQVEEDDNGGGATDPEVAKFVGTTTGDTSGSQFPLVFVADNEVDWATVDEDDNISVQGPVMVATTYRFAVRLDMTNATGFSTDAQAPESDVTIRASRVPGDGFGVNCGGPLYSWPTGTPGLVLEGESVEEGITQPSRASANEVMAIQGTVNALAYDAESAPVTNGEFTAAVAVWIRRQPLPDAPAL